ncbi:hypothetical protein C8R45DRAFT_167709 [Mycena sanguinolenta]|nr:hypothetical protein C8R45DRAFT_167709 [Mycena sanguinolenta]
MSNSTPLPDPLLPPELIDTALWELDDLESLKACSLVSSSLRFISQRILFYTLTVTVENCGAIFQRLTESPHLADHVRSLVIRTLHAAMPSQDVAKFGQILDKLQNVRRCMLDGLWGRFPVLGAPEQPLFPPLAIPQPLMDFLLRQRLQEISLICIRIPTAILWHSLTTVPNLYFHESVVIQNGPAAPTIVETPVLRSLILNSDKDIGQYIVRPQNMQCLADLRHLSFCSPGDGWARKLIEAASRTLEHIHFDCAEHPPLNLPPLPALRTLKLTFFGRYKSSRIAGVISRTTNILSSLIFPDMLPALAEVSIEQHFAENGAFDAWPYLPLITLLEVALAAYPTPPRIHWFLVMNDEGTLCQDFADTVRGEMPKAHRAERLVLEACVPFRTPLETVGVSTIEIHFFLRLIRIYSQLRI